MPSPPSDPGEVISQRLKDPHIQKALAEVLSAYWNDLQDILTIATVQCNGVRPEGLTNEVYACFHHIARALCGEEVHCEQELASAKQSHIKRATLDSYKIAINSYLHEEARAEELLDYMVLVEDFSRYIPDGHQKVMAAKGHARYIREQYKNAKAAEIRGNFDEAMKYFNLALERCATLREAIEVFTKDNSYLLACAREAKKDKEARKGRRTAILTGVLSAVVASILTVLLPRLVSIWF
jgi:hypothetical protein